MLGRGDGRTVAFWHASVWLMFVSSTARCYCGVGVPKSAVRTHIISQARPPDIPDEEHDGAAEASKQVVLATELWDTAPRAVIWTYHDMHYFLCICLHYECINKLIKQMNL